MDLNQTVTKCTTQVHDIHLQDIERPEYMGKRVRMPLIVAGVGKTYSIPEEAVVRCTGAEGVTSLCFEGQKSFPIAGVPGFCLSCIGKNEKQMQENLHSIGWEPSADQQEKIEQIFKV